MELQKVMSINVKGDGLMGRPFMVAAIVYDEKGNKVDSICLRITDDAVKDENIIKLLPLIDCPITHDIKLIDIPKEDAIDVAYRSMIFDFTQWYIKYGLEYNSIWYNKYSEDVFSLVNVPHIIDGCLFREMFRFGFIEWCEVPSKHTEASAYLSQIGYPVSNIEAYAKLHTLEIEDYGSINNPLYDCDMAYKCYKHIVENDKENVNKEDNVTKILNVLDNRNIVNGVIYEGSEKINLLQGLPPIDDSDTDIVKRIQDSTAKIADAHAFIYRELMELYKKI